MTELTIIEYTNDLVLNQYLSIFTYITAILVSFFGALSLMSR